MVDGRQSGPVNQRPFVSMDDGEEFMSGLEVTREQISDAYTAGTSDGVIFLGGGKTLSAQPNPQTTGNS